MSALLAGVLVGLVVALLIAPRAAGSRVLVATGSGARRVRGPARGDLSTPAAILLGIAIMVVIGGVPGLVAAVVVAPLTRWALRRVRHGDDRRRSGLLAAQVPVACDLMAAMLESGAEPAGALRAVAEAVGDPIRPVLTDVRARLELGADARSAWAAAAAQPALAPVAAAMVRVADSGAMVAEPLRRVAADLRAARRAELLSRARVVGVRAVLPLGLCFLPGFLLIGVLPVVASLVGEVLAFGR